MSCKYCEKPAFYAVHSGIKIPPIMTCQKHILKGIAGVFLAQDTYQVTVQDMNKYNLWKARNFTKNYGTSKVKDNNYHIALVDTWLSGFKSIMDAKPIRITFRYARRVPLTMVIKAKDWNNLKLAFLERPEIYKIDDAHLAGGATITHYINRHRAWYLDVWEVARKIKFVFGPLHLDAYQGNMRIEPAPLGFEEDIKLENPTTGEVSFPKPPDFMNIHTSADNVRIPLTPELGEKVQELLEKSMNTQVGMSVSGRMTSKASNIAEKPNFLCQTDFCANCGDRVTIGSDHKFNQKVVCLKCFKNASQTAEHICELCGTKAVIAINHKWYCRKCKSEVTKAIRCATCGAPNYTHSLGGKVYCDKCWDKITCCHCDRIAGHNSVAYNGRIFCKSCYETLSRSEEKLKNYSPNDTLIPNDCLERKVYTRSEFMAEHPDDPDAHRILGGGVGDVSFIVIDDPTADNIDPAKGLKVCDKCKESKVCPEAITINGKPLCQDCYDKLHRPDYKGCKNCGKPLTEANEDGYCPECKAKFGVCEHCTEPATLVVDNHKVCKTCYDRFYNPEINYRCKGCGAIIPDKGKICSKCGPECAHCKTHEGPFKTIDHKLYCHGCADMCKVRPQRTEAEQLAYDKWMDGDSVIPPEPVRASKCIKCGVDTTTYLQGVPYCEKCLEAEGWHDSKPDSKPEPKICHECGDPLGDDAVTTPNAQTVCRTCYDDFPNCVICGRSDVNLPHKLESGLKVCKACYNKLPKCPMCGKPLNDNKVCEDCARKDDSTSHA